MSPKSTQHSEKGYGYIARIEKDSTNVENNVRLTTMVLKYPRFVHSELMTHRVFSRNSASSRAIPIKKMIKNVLRDPVIPVWFGKNQSGMQAAEELTGWRYKLAKFLWLKIRYIAVVFVWLLSKVGLHKQIANRILEPWMWIEVIVTSTEWENFFKLRCHPDAQPEIKKIAEMAKQLYDTNTPRPIELAEWHIPFCSITDKEIDEVLYNYDCTVFLKRLERDIKSPTLNITLDSKLLVKLMISAGRIARVSYLTYDNKYNPIEDFKLAIRLYTSGHWSPFEHIAIAKKSTAYSGNLSGYFQFRKFFRGESGRAN